MRLAQHRAEYPLSSLGARIATVLGVLMALWSSVGVLFVSREEEMAPKIPGVLGPGVAAALGALIAALGWRRR